MFHIKEQEQPSSFKEWSKDRDWKKEWKRERGGGGKNFWWLFIPEDDHHLLLSFSFSRTTHYERAWTERSLNSKSRNTFSALLCFLSLPVVFGLVLKNRTIHWSWKWKGEEETKWRRRKTRIQILLFSFTLSLLRSWKRERQQVRDSPKGGSGQRTFDPWCESEFSLSLNGQKCCILKGEEKYTRKRKKERTSFKKKRETWYIMVLSFVRWKEDLRRRVIC